MLSWKYKGLELTDNMIPKGSVGFVYIIRYVDGRRYIGRKLMTKSHRRQKNKKIIKSRVDSDWRDYWSSSPEIAAIIEQEGGTQNFSREILMFTANKSVLNYVEEKLQMVLGVIETDRYLNSNVRSKYFARSIGKLDVDEMNAIISTLLYN